MKHSIATLILFFLHSTAVVATDFYLDQSLGNVNTDGLTIATAFSVATDSLDVLQAGDTLYVKGEYHNPSYNPNYTYNDNIEDVHI